jgi:hypothetical protein
VTDTGHEENPHAGQGAVLLDIGGDVGALIVTMPASMEGTEVEVRPTSGADLGSGHSHHGHDPGHAHLGDEHLHVAVVKRPVRDTYVASLVFPELVAGRYGLYGKGTDDLRLTAEVRGGEVTEVAWPL